MRTRCKDSNTKAYENYGAKGIKVCSRWDVFENFLEDMGERPSINYSIERIDSTGDYCPDNCKWATRIEQNRNRSMCIFITIDGKCQTVKEWAIELGIKRQTIERRLKLGWSHYDAVMQPVVLGQKFKKT